MATRDLSESKSSLLIRALQTGNSQKNTSSITTPEWKEGLAQRKKETLIAQIEMFTLNPDALIWLCPLYGVHYYEAAFSQDTLKYRSIEGQFLAKQPGGQHSLRIDALLKGPLALFTLTMLQFIYISGMAKTEMNKGLVEFLQNNMFTGPNSIPKEIYIEQTKNLTHLKADNKDNRFEYTKVNDLSMDWMRSAYHEAFAIVTKDLILYDMYIESLIYWQDLDSTDKDSIHVSLLFHKYYEPPKIRDVFSGVMNKLSTKYAQDMTLPQNIQALTENASGIDYRDIPIFQKTLSNLGQFIKVENEDIQTENLVEVSMNYYNIIANLYLPKLFSNLLKIPFVRKFYGYSGTFDFLRNREIKNAGIYRTMLYCNYANPMAVGLSELFLETQVSSLASTAIETIILDKTILMLDSNNSAKISMMEAYDIIDKKSIKFTSPKVLYNIKNTYIGLNISYIWRNFYITIIRKNFWDNKTPYFQKSFIIPASSKSLYGYIENNVIHLFTIQTNEEDKQYSIIYIALKRKPVEINAY